MAFISFTKNLLEENKLLLPSPILPGDTIGIIAPAGQLKDKQPFNEGIKLLKELGYNVKFPRNLWPGSGFLSDTDQNRSIEFHKLWADNDIKGIMCLRGGYGSLRMLPHLDMKEIKRSPKLLIGFSDITILQNHLFSRAGIPSIQGPVVTSIKDAPRETLQLFQQTLAGQTEYIFNEKEVELIHGNLGAKGTLIGGNLTSLLTLLGTPYDITYDDAILFLEDVCEPIYKIDRMLTQLAMANKFDKLKGILLGNFSGKADESSADKLRHTDAVWTRIIQLVNERNIPILAQISSGHINKNNPFIIGSQLIIEPGSNKITTIVYENNC